MDPEISALANAFSGAVVASMATDTWHEARTRFVRIWRQFLPGRIEATERLLEANRSRLIGMQGAPRRQFERLLIDKWRLEAAALIASSPAASEVVAALVAETRSREVSVHQSGCSHGNSRIFMAGQDQNFGRHE
jgi:hypothetical protein